MTKFTFVTLCALATFLILPPVFAGEQTRSYSSTTTTTTLQSAAEREIARRKEAMIRASEAIAKGDKAMEERDYEVAAAQYKIACDLLPESVTTSSLRREALAGFCEASVRLAEQRIAEGRYADAETAAKAVLDERYDPRCREARQLLANLEDPDYYNKTITPKFRGNVEEVKKLFVEAQGFYDTARYDLAFKRYEQILNFDPYNIAARKGQEKVNLARSNYAVTAREETRSRAVWRVDNAWQNPVRKFGERGGSTYITGPLDIRGTQGIIDKLNKIIIPKIEFREATVREAVDFLKQKSREFDPETDPSKPKGVNIVLKLESSAGAGFAPPPPAPEASAIPGLETAPAGVLPTTPAAPLVNPSEAKITIALTQIPLMEALRYIVDLASLKIKIDPYAVSIVPITENTEALLTKEYRVPPGFISTAPGGGASGVLNAPAQTVGGGGGAGSDDATRGGSMKTRVSARDYLEQSGVVFPPGASAQFIPSGSRLVVRNTAANLDLVDTLVESARGDVPAQVEIEAKFVEITQQNLKELSFDFLLGQFNVPGSNRVFGGGGVAGTSQGVNPIDFPFISPSTQQPVGRLPITGGTRSGNVAISANAIDALLFGQEGVSQVAPGIFGISGVFTDPSFQMVIRALNQKKGVDLLSAPRVTTKSGQRAVIEIIREFRYPTEFDPPQIPQTIGGNFGASGGTLVDPLGIQSTNSGTFPVTPTTPTAFETRNTGVTLECEPVVGPDGYTIDLNLVPQVVEFEGFINYGSPIQTTSTNALGISQVNVITPNVINQPIFSSRKVTTSVSIWDGQTVVLGGLMREDIQKVEDKVPFIGDLPLIGRLFRSSVDQHLKRNLVIFVTARLINPAGEPVNLEEEKEEVVEALTPVEVAPSMLPEAPLFPK